jgi:actin-related protein 6
MDRVNPRKNPIVQEYVLPDFSTNRRGYIRKGPNARPGDPCPIVEDGSGTPAEKPPADEPVLYMSNERFTVPEVLMHPSDIGRCRRSDCVPAHRNNALHNNYLGLDQSGLADTIAASIFSLPVDLQGIFWANIGLIGGNFDIPGIETRL